MHCGGVGIVFAAVGLATPRMLLAPLRELFAERRVHPLGDVALRAEQPVRRRRRAQRLLHLERRAGALARIALERAEGDHVEDRGGPEPDLARRIDLLREHVVSAAASLDAWKSGQPVSAVQRRMPTEKTSDRQ